MQAPDDSLIKAVERFTLSPRAPFGEAMSPVMATCTYKNGQWDEPKIVPYGPLSLMPNTKVLHYGQEIFEGMKAYYVDKQGPFLFRPQENSQRFNASAKRMAMPEIPEDIFLDSVSHVTRYSLPLIPREQGKSLYIRPVMFAIEESLGITPSKEFLFIVMAAPCGDYFEGKSLKLWVERTFIRSCSGGVGTAKTGGNYAASMRSAVDTVGRNLDQPLWIDALTREYIEEMSGMNFFCVRDNILYTPKLTDSILNGITRKSLLQLTSLEVRECPLKINEILSDIEKGVCTEAFACGTAVVVTPIASLTDGGKVYTLKNSFGPITKQLRSSLLDIQEGRVPGPTGWAYRVPELH